MADPLVKNAASVAQVTAASNKILNGRQRELEDLRGILAMPSGRRLLWRYLEFCGINRISYRGNTKETIFLEGCRNVGVMIQEDINEADPESYFKMIRECKS